MKLSALQELIQTMGLPQPQPGQARQLEVLREMGLEPGSFYQELEMDSRYVDAHQDSSYSNANVSLHSHSFYELLYCRNTCGAEYLVGADRYRLQKGDIILIAPGVSHRPLLPDRMADPYVRDVMWISTEFMDSVRRQFPEFLAGDPQYSSLLRTGGTKWKTLGELFHKCVWESENKKPGWETAIIGNTLLLLSMLYRAFLDSSARFMKAEKPELLDQVLAYIETHLQEKLTLNQAAHHFFVSESTISQTFRNKMGVSFYRCVTQRRLITAKTLIAEGLALEQVSRQVGFSDYSAFYRAFRQEYGINPRQYRKLLESGDQNPVQA